MNELRELLGDEASYKFLNQIYSSKASESREPTPSLQTFATFSNPLEQKKIKEISCDIT